MTILDNDAVNAVSILLTTVLTAYVCIYIFQKTSWVNLELNPIFHWAMYCDLSLHGSWKWNSLQLLCDCIGRICIMAQKGRFISSLILMVHWKLFIFPLQNVTILELPFIRIYPLFGTDAVSDRFFLEFLLVPCLFWNVKILLNSNIDWLQC